MLSCSLKTFLYVRIASITNVTIMANGKCIGILHNSCIDEKIEINPKNPKYLKVVWGIGYKVEKI